MISALTQTPEFAAPLPRRLVSATLLLSAALIAGLSSIPTKSPLPATIVANATR